MLFTLRDIEVTGLIPAHTIYSAYWNQVSPTPEKVVLMRSPLVDSSEVTVCSISRNQEMDKWYSGLKSGLILSIYDVNTLSMQNCDFDGDRCFSSNDPILIKGAQKDPIPILYQSAGAQLKGAITFESMIEADIRGLNSSVGSLSNQATGLYALRDNYPKGSPEYTELTRRIKIVSELVGVEIDKIKTGIPPEKPSSWNKEKIPFKQFVDTDGKITNAPDCSQEEQERIQKHNELIPDRKPYFMRYIYASLDRELIKYDMAFESVCKYNFGIGLTDLLSIPYENLGDAERRVVKKYHGYFPVIDGPCTMNKVCKKFECLQKNLKRHNNSTDMLKNFTTEQELDDDIFSQVAEYIDLLQRQKRFITRTNKVLNEPNKQIALDTKVRFDELYAHIRKQILALVGGDVQTAFNYMIELVRRKQCQESIVWQILGDLVLLVIPAKPYHGGRVQ